MSTTVFLIRHGVTEWHRERRVLGQRDLSLSATGREQAAATAAALADVDIAEVLSSPLQRALETAQVIADSRGIQVARDKRLTDIHAGRWEGLTHDEIANTPEYQRFLADPLADSIPDGERLSVVRDRMVRSLEQVLADTPAGQSVAVVSHAGPLRLLLARYLGAPPGSYHRLHLAPGSVSALRFEGDRELPRVLVMNWLGGFKAAVS